MTSQLSLQYRNSGGRVAPVAISNGAERRQIGREATVGTGAACVAPSQVSELGAVSGIVALGERRGRDRTGEEGERSKHL